MTRVTNEEMADMMRADIAALKAENARLREALEGALDFINAANDYNRQDRGYWELHNRVTAALTPHSTESYPTPPRATEEEG